MGHSKLNTLTRTFINFFQIKLLMKAKGVSFKNLKVAKETDRASTIFQLLRRKGEGEGPYWPLGTVSMLLIIRESHPHAAYFTFPAVDAWEEGEKAYSAEVDRRGVAERHAASIRDAVNTSLGLEVGYPETT